MELTDIATLIGLGIAIQFIAAILGPGVLRFASVLLFLAAGGVAAYLVHLGLNEQYAGIGADTFELATKFGGIALALAITHFVMRGWFRAMARASQAA
jgi:hypothetical protein